MARINKAKLRSKIVEEIQADCKIRIPATKIKLETEVEPLVEFMVTINDKLESGLLSKDDAFLLLDKEIEKSAIVLLKENDSSIQNLALLKSSIHSLATQLKIGGGSVDL